jgi:hypothetical protein
MATILSPADARPQRPLALPLSLDSRLRLEALETIFQQPSSEIVERAILGLLDRMAEADRLLVEALVNRARQAISDSKQNGTSRDSDLKTCYTVTGKEFRYRGSLAEDVEVVFDNSQPLRITRESIDHITHEIQERQGPALMGAIYSPLMPDSIGEAISRKYRLSPINLSYIIPLLREQGLVRTFKESRNWFVETATKAES